MKSRGRKNQKTKNCSYNETQNPVPKDGGQQWPVRKIVGALMLLLAFALRSAIQWDGDVLIVGFNRTSSRAKLNEYRREQVKKAFMTSWDAYSRHAWGNDTYHPVSQKGSNLSPHGPLGWIIIDSLDTLMLMNLTTQLSDSRKWLHRSLSYDQDQDVNTFETTIRMLGGLLSAHHLVTSSHSLLPGHNISSLRDGIYLSKAIDLADRLLGAFDSPSGIPYASVHLGKKVGIPSHDVTTSGGGTVEGITGGSSSLAEAATLQLEMKYLSHLTGDDRYWRAAERVMAVLDANAAEDGLLPIYVHPDTGSFTTREIRLGSRGDSYYEYLIKQHLQTTEQVYLSLWQEALAGIQKHLLTATKHSNLRFIAELPTGIGGPLNPKMDHLTCFLPGAIALGATGGLALSEARRQGRNFPGGGWTASQENQIYLARELLKTCWAMNAVTATGLAPEIAYFNAAEEDLQPGPGGGRSPHSKRRSSEAHVLWKKDIRIKPADAHNLQRPETVESLFVLWRITGDPVYQERGWKIFEAFERHTRLGGGGEGYTSIDNVNAVPSTLRDNMESFWLAETLKYFYLLFSPTDFIPLHQVVFNTEAHIFPRITKTRWKTG